MGGVFGGLAGLLCLFVGFFHVTKWTRQSPVLGANATKPPIFAHSLNRVEVATELSDSALKDSERRQIVEAARSEIAVDKVASKLFEEPYQLKTGKPVEAARGLISRMNIDTAEFYRLIAKETEGIVEEVRTFAQESQESAVREVQELLNYILYERSSEKEYPNGIRDKGRVGKDLVYFITHAKAQKAGLKQPEVVALRLYTTAAYR